MKFFTVGLDFKTAPLELRARAASKESNFVRSIAPKTNEYVWISTCNRADLFGVGEDEPESVLDSWIKHLQLSPEDRARFHIFQNEECLSYLFRVTASLESMVVGEVQITSQLKRAYDESVKSGHVGPVLHKSFQKAFKLNKRIRSQTEVGRLAVSIPSVAVKLSEKIFGSLTSKTIGIIGLGEIGRVASEHYASVQPKKLLLFNRTASVAEELAQKLNKENENAIVASSIDSLLGEADVIVSAADAVVVSKQQLKALDHRGRDKLLIDLSVPTSVESDAADQWQSLFIYSIDDLKKIADENTILRQQEMAKANALVAEEVLLCWRTFQGLGASVGGLSQTIQNLAAKADQMTQAELAELKRRLPGISAEQWSEIEKMAHRLSSKLLQDPMGELKLKVESQEASESWMKFFKELFRID